MSVLNQFTKHLTGFQSALVSETRLHAVEPDSTALTMQTRSRRIGSETYTYSGGSRDAAGALKAELEETEGMGEVYGYSNGPAQDNPTGPDVWTVIATQKIIGDWGAWT